MEDKKEINEINEVNEKNEKEEIDQKLFSNYSKNFSELLSEKERQFSLLKSFYESFYELYQYNLKHINEIEERMKNFDKTFLMKEEDIAGLEDTLIFKLCKILKKINKTELNYLQKHSNYLNCRCGIFYSIQRFIEQYQYLNNYYSVIKPLINDLNASYRKIELKSIDKYIERKPDITLARKNTIKSTEEIIIARKFEDRIDEINKQKKEVVFLNLELKTAISRLKKFSDSIIEEVQDKDNLNDLKKEINSIYELSEKGQIYDIWNFDAPMIQSEYKFNLFDIKPIPLKDGNKYNLTAVDQDNILNFIQDRKVENIVLHLNTMAGEMLKSKDLIKKILGTNSTQYTTSENKVEELIKLLVNYNNIKTTLIQLNNFRAKSVELKKEVFDIVKKILEITADYLLKNPNSDLAHLLIILSETFTLNENTKQKENIKHFLCEDIKEHKLFKIDAFWENLLLHYMDEQLFSNKHLVISKERIKKKVLNSNESLKVGNLIVAAIIGFKTKKESFGMSEERIMRILYNILAEYQETVQDYVVSNFKF